MYISYNNTSKTIIWIDEKEDLCRRIAKGLDWPEYWTWMATITSTSSTGVISYDFPSEDFTVVKCTDQYEEIQRRLGVLKPYITINPDHISMTIYNVKWSDSKVKCEEILDSFGNSYATKKYVKSNFVPDDTARNARILVDEWIKIRKQRDKLLAETDWMSFADSPSLSNAWKTYRAALRTLPADQSSKTTYASITWPSKP